MFNFFKIAELKNTIIDLERRLEGRGLAIATLEERIKDMELAKVDAIKEDVNSSEFKINWDKMDAFSIERMGDHQSAYTVIGYYLADEHNVKHVHEWKFYCSQEQHNKLAGEFNNGIAEKNHSGMRERSDSGRKK
jgi:hypothetical protein